MSGREEVFQQAMNQGHSAAWDQMWDKAASFYIQALDEFPNHPKVLTSLGLAMYELQRYDESLQYYERAASFTNEDPLPHEKVAQLSERIGDIEAAAKASLQSAELYIKKREVEKAIENWSRVTRLNPDNLLAHSRLALVYERLGRKQQAVTEYLAVASLLQNTGEIEKAIQAVDHAIRVIPNSNEAHQALGMLRELKPLPKPIRARGSTGPLRMAQVRQLEAPKTTDHLSGLDPIAESRQKALSVLAGMLFEQSEVIPQKDTGTRRGVQFIGRGVSDGSSSKQADWTKIISHLSQAVDLQTHSQEEQAAQALEKAVEAGLDDVAVHYDIGLLRVKGNQPERALLHLQIAVKDPEYALGSRLLLGQSFRKLKRVEEATIEFLEALKLADSQIMNEAQADELRQLYDPLIEAEAKQTDLQAKIKLCDDISELIMRPDWRKHLSEARQNLPKESEGGLPMPMGEILVVARSSQIIESISNIHRMALMGQIRAAEEETYYALQFAPTYLPLHIYLGELLLQQDHQAEAVIKFSVVAQAYSVRNEHTRAIDLLRRIIQLAPIDLNVRNRIIEQLLARGLVEEAINEYLEMAEVYFSLADLNMARKTYMDALRLAQQSNTDRPIKIQILYQMADIDIQSLDWRQAIRVYEQIRTLQPDERQARKKLIILNFRMNQESQAIAELNNYISYMGSIGQKDKSVPFLKELVEEIPDQMPIRHSLSDELIKSGHTEQAISQLDIIGENLLAAKDQFGALKIVEEILGLNPARKEDYQRLLAQLRGI